MKKIVLSILIFSILGYCAYAEFKNNGWKYYKDLQGQTAVKDSYAVFEPDTEIYNASNAEIKDLRVIDNLNNETQYDIIVAPLINELSKRDAVIVKREFAPYRKDYSILELDTGEKRLPLNQIDLNISNSNFLKRIEVSGSEEQDIWHTLSANKYIYAVGEKGIKNTSVIIETSKYRYLKLKIYGESKEPLEISSASVWFNSAYSQRDRKTYENKITSKENEKAKATEVLVDLGFDNVPVDSIEVVTDEVNFSRNVDIKVGNKLEQLETILTKQEIYSYDLEKLTAREVNVGFGEVATRYIKLIINNSDNQPLNVKKVIVSGDRKKVVFKTKPERTYRIYYGSDIANTPNYEIKNIIPYIDIYKLPIFSVSKQENNPNFSPNKGNSGTNQSNNYQVYLYVTLGIMCAVLLFVMIRAFKKSME